MKKLAKQVGSAKKQTMGSKLSYIKKNWQLYVFFLMPALLLTIIFKYLPMGGLLIAFEDYNVIKGVLGSPWVGAGIFPEIFIITGFYELPAEHIKAEYLWTSLEFSDTNYSGTFTEPYPQGGD